MDLADLHALLLNVIQALSNVALPLHQMLLLPQELAPLLVQPMNAMMP